MNNVLDKERDGEEVFSAVFDLCLRLDDVKKNVTELLKRFDPYGQRPDLEAMSDLANAAISLHNDLVHSISDLRLVRCELLSEWKWLQAQADAKKLLDRVRVQKV